MESSNNCSNFDFHKCVVFIEGTEIMGYPWNRSSMSSMKKMLTGTNGIVVNFGNEKYVIALRGYFPRCKKIDMYYFCYDNDTDKDMPYAIVKNKLEILFQSYEFGLMILGTYNCWELDISRSEPYYCDYKINTKDIIYFPIEIEKQIEVIPNKNSDYYLCRHIGIPRNDYSCRLFFHIETYDVKYVDNVTHGLGYDGHILYYRFTFCSDKKPNIMKIFGGSVIYDRDNKLIGICSCYDSDNKLLVVFPLRIIKRVFHDFITYRYMQDKYHGFPVIPPFSYKIIQDGCKKQVRIANNVIIRGNKKSILRKNDILLEVFKKPLIVRDKNIYVHDDESNEDLSINNYALINLEHDSPIYLKVIRRNKILEYKINSYPSIFYLHNFPLTNYPYFGNKQDAFYINIKGIIITDFTVELIMSLREDGYEPFNRYIDNEMYFDNCNLPRLIIVHCRNRVLRNKYRLPDFNKKGSIHLPPIYSFNGIEIFTLDDLTKMIKESKELIIATEHSNGSPNQIAIKI